MDLSTSLELYDHRPSEWMIDTTPPEEWEVVIPPLTASTEFMAELNAGMTQFAKDLAKAFEPLSTVAKNIAEGMESGLNSACGVVDELVVMDEVANGTHKVLSAKPGIILPPRKVNAGPPKNQFARRGRDR